MGNRNSAVHDEKRVDHLMMVFPTRRCPIRNGSWTAIGESKKHLWIPFDNPEKIHFVILDSFQKLIP